ncbi:MAG: 23S rRNA (guanosine(2251)-2'-O)-methyltransferase RlmB [Bacteroidales bacterium]|nr:23S rRNA (guanosine(2251)-2'-O)-methyltransferase RlmB [Bacteroidales bacterium]
MSSKSGLIFGFHPVTEALQSGKTLDKVLIRQGMQSEQLSRLIHQLQKQNTHFQFVPVQKLNRMTGGNHQGVIALVSEIEYTELEQLIPALFEQGKLPAVAVLDGITDVRNLGAIARSALCAGMDALVIPASGSARINEDAVKTSSGALHSIPVCRVSRLKDAAVFLKESGLQLIAASEKAANLYYSADLLLPTAFILGAEDTGVDKKLLQMADKTVRIPVYGQVQSLNVSAAASVLFYEMVRQRMHEGKP